MSRFEFVNPELFWLLVVLPFLVLWQVLSWRKQQASVHIGSLGGFKATSGNWVAKSLPVLNVLRVLALAALIIALARPRMVDTTTSSRSLQGIDIIMAIDVSASMLARDLLPNRLDALKEVASNFIQSRKNDRIGIVVYAGESYTRTPLTVDKNVLLRSIKEIGFGEIKDGTAIGLGLSTAINRIKESEAKSKIIILLTDGVNNSGFIDPHTASEMAAALGIKVYTIGIGTNGMAMSPVAINPDGSFHFANIQVEIDEDLMKEIALETGGKYFRATSTDKLEDIYEEIDQLETSEIEETQYTRYEEKFRMFLIAGILFLVLEYLLRYTVYRSFI